MTAATPARTLPPAPNGGAWLGLGIAARAALSVATASATLATAAGLTLAVDGLGTVGRSEERPPEWGRLLDVLLDGAAILAPYSRIAGLTGIAVGVALFVAAAMLVGGSETARRATRVLLVVEAVHSAADAAWIAVLSCTTLVAWQVRYQQAVAEFLEASSGRRGGIPVLPHMNGWTGAVVCGVWGVVSAGVALVLWWLAGRAFARDWCAARERRSPVATSGGPR
jgi:hypothetical protein